MTGPDTGFDVVIVESTTGLVVSMTGRGLDARQAARRELTTLDRVAIERYFVTTVPAGQYKKGDVLEWK